MELKPIYGLLAEFDTPEDILAAAHRAREAGYKKFDAYTPIPVEGLAEAVGFDWTALPSLVLAGGILGGCTGFGMCYYANVVSYPWNIGGKPPNSWPMWIAITFELTILGASLVAVFGMLALKWLAQAYHPLVYRAAIHVAVTYCFLLVLNGRQQEIRSRRNKGVLESLRPSEVVEVEE